MKRFFSCIILLAAACCTINAQNYNQITDDGTFTEANNGRGRNFGRSDSIQSQHKEIPKGLKTWTIDKIFGDRTEVQADTLSHMFMNTIFTTGLRGEYNTLGNVGSPRINRIFIDRDENEDFVFMHPYDYFYKPIEQFHFTNTLSPITNVSYNTCGNRTNGEDHLKALFAVNAGKRLGLGMLFDYLYGRGYYSNQNTAHFNYTIYGSYLGERYQAHLLVSTYHQKTAENGGVTNDDYISHPERFNEAYTEEEIPVALSKNWNRNDHQHIFFNHRYSLGFSRKVPMTPEEIEARKFAIKSQKEQEALERKQQAQKRARENGEEWDEEEYEKEVRSAGRPEGARIAGNAPKIAENTDTTRIVVDSKEMRDSLLALEQTNNADTTWMKDEYVPVTSFIHTATFDNYRRIYQAYEVPTDFYLNTYENVGKYEGDSIFDQTKSWRLKNTFAVALLEGFNKWAKAGLKAFVTHEIRHYTLPDLNRGYAKFNENAVHIGAQLNKQEGKVLHYNVTGMLGVAGADAGDIQIDADADLNFRLLGDTIQLAAKGFFHSMAPTFYYCHYQSKHAWWDDDDLDKVIHTRIEGLFSLKRTKTQLRVAIDELKNYTYLGQTYDITQDEDNLLHTGNAIAVRQAGDPINLLTLQLRQDLSWRIFRWENVFTFQRSSKDEILPVPKFNIYTNLYLRFKIARVLKCDFGADMRYFTKYYAPEYVPAIGQFAVQENSVVKTKTGSYPIINLYANFHLKNTRFFVMLSHVNYRDGGNYFLTPHYPLNQRLIRFGLSWTFFN